MISLSIMSILKKHKLLFKGSSRKVECMMRDILLEELTKITTNAIDQVDKVNQKLVKIIVITIVVFGITVVGLVSAFCGFYFLSDYQYPEVTQETQQDVNGIKQEVKQEVKTSNNKGGDK